LIKNNIYRVWLWVGIRLGCIRKYNIERDKAMERAREALERAFTPQLKKMLEDSNVINETE
jgi:hypothetical protein